MRYAVIDIDSEGFETVAYIVTNEQEAIDLATDESAHEDGDSPSQIWKVKTPRGTFGTRNGIPIEDSFDQTKQEKHEYAARLKQYLIAENVEI
jgi:hypothetical protein